jgi:hypothetical protein
VEKIESLSLDKLSFLNPPLKKGDIGGFALGCRGKIPPHPPLQRGEYYFRTSSKYLILAVFLFSTVVLGCQNVQKPELKGEGPLAVTVARGTATPEYHAPAERWRVSHGQALNRGDFTQRECVLCHNPETGCNQCHQYVGTPKINVPEASLYWVNRNSK